MPPFSLPPLLLLLVLLLSGCHAALLSPFNFSQWNLAKRPPRRLCQRLRQRAVVYLVHPDRTHELRDSLVLLFRNFLDEFRYPVLVFHEGLLDEPETSALLAKALRPQQHCLVRFLQTAFTFPAGFDPAQARERGVVDEAGFPHHQHVRHFWFKAVFEHREVRRLQYFLRMDSDSLLVHPVNYDLFDFFQRKGLKYGYYRAMDDDASWSKGLWEFMDHYLAIQGLRQPTTIAFPKPRKMPRARVPMFYTNFEVVHVPTIVGRLDIQEFISGVDVTWRIYTHRWSDAVLRYFLVHIFLNVSRDVHHCCDLKYVHTPHQPKPITCCDELRHSVPHRPCT
eukprot:GGOE01053972.1.p1 GENE.GGOE01053972.1~~GGOE01053972.1.p1  ORF type:complete len:345 (-),score=99.01 GGOE01053972.1:484-1494(-)